MKKSSETIGDRLDNKAGSKPGLPESSPRSRSKPTFVQLRSPQPQSLNAALEKLTSSQSESGGGSSLKTYPILPEDLASDIQQFAESDYAKQYFSTHRTGFIFRRKIPVNQLMSWQKNPLAAPLLVINRALTRDAVKIFKVIQHIMGDREREKAVNVRLQPDTHVSMVASINSSTVSLNGTNAFILEEERWLLNEGLSHGELRDEIYCQLMKQLTSNPSTESVFKGWQSLCVLLITFPPSKNFETHLRSFIQSHTGQQEGRVDIMAKYCMRRLAAICRKGPRGKAPSISEIETASDAAFNPSTFGESLDAIIRLQERNYPHQRGIFRVPGDGDSVSELKLRIDRGYYNLDGVDDPHVLASLMKLWLRELCDPLIPEEVSEDANACVKIIQRLPTVNRRVVLFVISFLQLFVEDKVQAVTKMTPANLALVMAPNLLRCSSESMSVVFTNAQFEQLFVYNLLLSLKCNEVDPHYVPQHGLAAIETQPQPRVSKSRTRRALS
ncbi:Rho GTPase activation protein [Amanita rubescens]|nr:Rho GTPase activation protein [Amanita rubescens]